MSLVHVRIVTSDRTIHHFDSLEDAERFHKTAAARGRAGHGEHRQVVLTALAVPDAEIDSPELADICDSSPDAINGVLRQMATDGVIEIASVEAHNRRVYRITPDGRQELADIAAGLPACPRQRRQAKVITWMTRPGKEFWSGELEAAFGCSKSYASILIKQAVRDGVIRPSGDAIGRSHRQYYQPVSNQE